MTDRKPIPRSLRFEVFKRDKFTCQYCGAKAPEAVLQVDHIHPVAGGGGNDLLNLVTSCQSCNGGKGARLLSDDSAVEKQRRQLDELQERREQIEMLLEWREANRQLDDEVVDRVNSNIGSRTGYGLNELGKSQLRQLLKKNSMGEVLEAMDIAFDQYGQWDGNKMTEASWNEAWRKVPGIIRMKQSEAAKPYLLRLTYIQGILRRTCHSRRLRCMDALEEMHLEGAPVDVLEWYAKRVDGWDEFCAKVDKWLAENGATNG